MPHPNALKELKTYGLIAQTLDRLADDVDDRYGSGQSVGEATQDLIEFYLAQDIKPILNKIVKDKYAYNRELVAVTIMYLWQAWAYHDSDNLPKHALHKNPEELSWTLPLLQVLIEDRAAGPVELTVRALSEMRDTDETTHNLAETLLAHALSNKSADARLEVVRSVGSLIQMNDNAEWTANSSEIETLIKASEDKDEEVRNWAYFELHKIDNLDKRIANVFRSGIVKEKPESEAALEALVGLAKYDGRLTDEFVCARIRTMDCTALWLDAANESHSTECLEALIDLYQATREEDDQEGINEYWYDQLESIIKYWNN